MRLLDAGRWEAAAQLCRGVLATDPRHSQALHMLGRILVDHQDQAEAGLQLIEQALAIDPGHPAMHDARGQALLRLARPVEAVPAFERALSLQPEDIRLRHHLGLALRDAGRPQQAEIVVRETLARQPQAPGLLNNLGVLLMRRGDLAQAQRVLEQAQAVAPDYAEPYANLALLYEQQNRLEDAVRITRQGLQRWPEHIALRFAEARCQRRRGEYQDARESLLALRQGSMTAKLESDIEYELGQCADALGDTAAAFRHFTLANRKVRESWSLPVAASHAYAELLNTLDARFTREWVTHWSDVPVADAQQDPVFIVGFPRSGTTLLDTMLAAHPQLALLEEPPTVQAVLERLHTWPGGYPDALATLMPAQHAALRAAYFDSAHALSDASGRRRILDKSPFNTAHVGLIQRLFPAAHILFAVRHPCDVVLSCFMSNFEPNSGTLHFTALDTGVRLYCRVMSLWLAYVEILPLRYCPVRYEQLVDTPAAELRRVLDFLGLPWSDSVLDHVTAAGKRSRIPTASYAQVGRPLYREARYRWLRYAEHLQPFLTQLRPFIKAFGYDD
ncbi:MAG: sulfotransferase [Gammaproteobacteria bacterium]|nr:sulfotransferase [Gammaproteobacteria bacterium]